MRDRKNVPFFKSRIRIRDPDPGSGFKILICRIRIRPKMDRIHNPGKYLPRPCVNIGPRRIIIE